jgi:hypothetical protein
MVNMNELSEEDRKMCEEWEELYKKPLPLIKDEGYEDMYSHLAETMRQHAIPRQQESITKVMEEGENARRKAGIKYDINEYQFDAMGIRCEGGANPDARLFIGIPYKLGSIGFDGCDCMGLAQLLYACNGWHLPKLKEGWNGTKDMFRYVRRYFKRIEKSDLQYGDLILHGNHADIFLGWSPSNKNDYVILCQAINSGEGNTVSKVYCFGDTEYKESFDCKAEYFHRDESKDKENKYRITIYDEEVIKINLLGNPFEKRDPFYFALYRGYSIDNAEKMAQVTESNLTMIDGRINHAVEKSYQRNVEKLYKELKRVQDDFNLEAKKEGRPIVELV